MFATPILRAIRRRYPDAHLCWVVEPKAADVVMGNPAIDEVIVWDRPEWKRLATGRRFGELQRAWRDFRARLRAHDWDFAIDMQGLSRSGLVTWLSGAPIRIALGPKEGSGLLMTHRYPTGIHLAKMSEEPRRMAEWLGLDTSGWALDLHLSGEVRVGADRHLAAAGLDGDFIILVPFTTRPWKHWPEERWAPLAGALSERFGLPLALAGGPADRESADRILASAAEAGTEIVDLVGRTSLAEAVAVVSRARLLIGVDTALTHAAHAFQTPAICLFGPAGYTEPPTPVTRMVRHWLDCVPCQALGKRLICGDEHWCMDLITGQEIMGHAEDLLAPAASGG